MSSPLRQSQFRLIVGISCLGLGGLVALLVLPDASRQLENERRARANAKAALEQQEKTLKEYQDLTDQIRQGQERILALEKNMPQGSVGDLQWTLSKALHELSQKYAVRLQSIKYGTPSREGAKGTDLEAMDVEFSALGVFQNIKPFMMALEGSGLPFAVSSVRMEESPEGARLSVTLRAFRKAGAKDAAREEA